MLGLALAACSAATSALAADLALHVAEKEPPKELDASLRGVLQNKAVQLRDGDKPALEFWFAAEVALTAKPSSASKALDAVKPATLLGALVVPKARRDYRDDELAADVYTMRFALQPQDGNHLGTADYTYFAVLVPAKFDNKLDGITDYKTLVKTSSKGTSTEHPVVLSLRPARSEEGEFPAQNDPAPEHKSVRVKLPAKVAGSGEKMSLVFEVVYEGKANK